MPFQYFTCAVTAFDRTWGGKPSSDPSGTFRSYTFPAMLQDIEALGIIYLGMLVLVPVMFAGKYRRYHGHWPDRRRWLFFFILTLIIEIVAGPIGWILGKYKK
jgi:hypothetical protein